MPQRQLIQVAKRGGSYGCSECDWIFPHRSDDPPVGLTIEEQIADYVKERDAAFNAHLCKNEQSSERK